jgi:phosphoglycerol transferase MdoB-like AlkP superfamily enzyme
MKHIDFRLRLFLCLLGLFLLAFTTARVSLIIIYSDSFKTLTASQFVMSFLSGLKFDLATAATFVGIPFLMISLPVFNRKWFKTWSLIAIIEFFLMAPVLVADLIFFGHVKRHIGEEIKLIGNDFEFLKDFILGDYFIHVVVILAMPALLFVLFSRLIDKWYSKDFKLTTEPIRILFIIFFLVMAIRGWTFHGKPVGVADAFDYGSSAYGNIVLNGVFTSYQSARSSRSINHNFFGKDKAIDTAQRLVVEDDEEVINTLYPLMRERKSYSVNGEGYNVVIILLESWSFRFMDSFSGADYGVTPNFDSLANNGLMFTNFYANGQRSVFGIAATLVGVPTIPGIPFLGRGLEISNITRLGSILKARSYSSVGVQTSGRGSFRLEGIASALGFDEFYGREDISIVFPYQTDQAPSWGYDYDGLMLFKEKLDNIGRPFLGFFFSGTTHSPYVLLHEMFKKYPEDEPINRYLNSLYYSDYSLGEFFKFAKETDWFENTIFIITADHALGHMQKDTLDDKFRIPLVIYCPKLLPHKKFDFLSSQADLLPTIFEMLKLKSPYSSMGKSLLGDYENSITDNGAIKHSLKTRLETHAFKEGFDVDEAEKLLLSLDEAVHSLLKDNRWYQPD